MKTLSLCASAVLLLVACGGAQPPADAPEAGGPAALNKAKCGACHAPFEPGVASKADLQPILQRHKDQDRAKLTDEQWAQMVDYLAKK